MTKSAQTDLMLSRWLKWSGLGLVLVVFLIGIAVLMAEVVRKLDALRTAESDSVQWALSQVEVEFLLAHQELRTAMAAPDADLGELRKRFDIFYSRAETVASSPLFAPVRALPADATSMRRTMDFLSDAAPLIDGPDPALRAALPQLDARMTVLRPQIRSLTVGGLAVFTRLSDVRRTGLAGTLMRLALVALGLILVLLVTVAALARLNRINRERMAENVQTRARLETILATSLDAVLVTDSAGRILEFNGAAEKIFGYATAEVLGRRVAETLVPDHMVETHGAVLRRYLAGEPTPTTGGGRMRMEARRKNGSLFPVELSLATAREGEGEIFISFIRDISARDAADRALLEARDRALAGERAKAEFLAVMSHEMRTPLNGLLGTIDLLARSGLTPRQREYVEIVEASGGLLLRHVNDVLDIAKAEAGKMAIERVPFDLAALLDEVAASQRSLAEAAGNTIVVDLPDSSPGLVSGDPARLRQVLLNLVGNAVKFTERGRITLAARPVPDPLGRRGEVEIRVADTGVGIAEADLDRVFGDFVTLDTSYRRNTEGTGLGLGIARRMVEAMGGEIGVESRPGAGSTFWVRLPLPPADEPAWTPAGPEPAEAIAGGTAGTAEAAMAAEPAAGPAAGPRATPLSVLVVEDNRINRFVVREMLEAEGHRVTEAADGRAGARLAQAQRFDLILMDVSMPLMDGVEATRRIRTAPGGSCKSPIVGLTAHALPGERAGFRQAGMNDCLTKPVTRAALIRLMGAVAEGRSLRDPTGAGIVPDAEARIGDAVALEETAAAETAPEAALDPDHLDEMAWQIGPDRFAGLLARFLDEGDALARLLEGGKSPSDLAEALHKLAGSAGVFGAQALQERLGRAEIAARAGDTAAVAALAPDLAAVWTETRAWLQGRSRAGVAPDG